jgi:hypothetical protein
MESQSTFGFSTDGPFFPMVATFLLSTCGLGPLYQPDNPLRLSATNAAWYRGKIEPELLIDLEQIRQITNHLAADVAVQELCGMLIISAHAVAVDSAQLTRAILETPEFEFFRHVRNAAAHGNRFTFKNREPKRPAAWRTLTLDAKTHAGSQCFGGLLIAADALSLLSDVQKLLKSAGHEFD